MAEKHAAIAAERREMEAAQRKQFEAHGAFWDSLGGASSSGAASAQSHALDGLDDLLQPAAPAAPAAPPVVVVPADPFDFDAFEIAETRKSGATSASETRTPVSHFDFGDGDGNVYGDDDLLGELGKPAAAAAAAAQDRASPPPHIVGQIVEMGFAPTQARQALAKTSTGLDVQQALDLLLAAAAGGAGRQTSGPPSRSRDGGDVSTAAQAAAAAAAAAAAEAAEKERRRRRRAGPLRDSIKPATQPRPQPREEQEHGNDAQDQAERILAQASEIGQSMFNKATLFWNSSKERAIKVYEEQRKAAMEAAEREDDKRKNPKSARPRPKWMQQENEDWKDERLQVKGGFKDSDDDDEQEGKQATTTQSGNLLFDAGHPGPSRPSSRPKPVARPAPASSSSSSSSPKPRPASSPQPPRPASPRPARTIVPATPQQLESSTAHKTKGNHHFKLGRFTEAESAYSSAIAALPRGNLFLIPLLTNRATARLKLGDSVNAAGDCTTVIDNLVGPSYHPSKEAPLPPEYAEIKLGEGLSKAMVKRAQAWEMGEKWKAALDDWERVMGLDVVILGGGASSMRHMAAEGARRARRMLKMQGGETPSSMSSSLTTTTTTSTTASTPRPVAASPAPFRPSASAATSAADVNRSAAVADLRKAAQALEAEEEARLKHKDHVDNKITNWKTGKETNLRALIASLDTVLWDDIVKEGGLKVGMHELVTDKQVKIKYMKVIARLHPDKVSGE